MIFSLSQFIGCFFNDVGHIMTFPLTHDNVKSFSNFLISFNVCKILKLLTKAVILLKTCDDINKVFWKILLPLIEKVISYIRVFDIQLSLHEAFFKQLDLIIIQFCIINFLHQIQEKLLEDPKSANNEAAIMVVYYVRWTIFIFFRVFKHVSKSLIFNNC